MAAYASLVSLMQLIHDLHRHPSPPISLDKHLVESITQHITFFQEFLGSYNPPDNGDEEEVADPLEMRIANTAYAAEDAIESHIVDRFRQLRSNKITRLLNCIRPSNELKSINQCRDSLQRVIEEMDSIKKVVVDPEKQKKKEDVVLDQVGMTSVLPSVARNKTILGSDDVLASVARNETMVGIDDVLLEIMEKLVGAQLDFQVIPIGGMGGIGKTFLAKTVYSRPLIKDRFDICAWATISQQYNTREILCELLSQATNTKKEQLSGKSEDVLGLELHKYLFSRRFLIVIDDIWSIDAWDKIQCFFPNNENGSRVLVTTRLFQLCSQLNRNYSLRMSFLDEASSWDLFSKTVFGDKSCPPVLKKIAEKIAANCRGLPLSIVVVGGLLKNMDSSTQGSWESIRDNVSSVVNMENDKHCLRLLKLSYNHLPVYLKPCFLYMGVFEEDDEIRVSTLVKLWVSEGFLQSTNAESLERTARGFLQDLVDRNLILICELGSTGSIKSCKMHDLLRDVCLKESQKDGFYHVIGQSNPPVMNTHRRVVIPRNTLKEKSRDELRSMAYARSVICEHGKVPPLQNLKLLRTLHAYKLWYYGHKKCVAFRYLNLRHLAISTPSVSSLLPSVSILWNLQTLIVLSGNKGRYVLADIWKMPQFRHIEFVGRGFCLPEPPRVVRDEDVIIMENLHTLKGVINFKYSEGVAKRIPNIKKLRLGYAYDVEDEPCVGNIKSLCGLESLTVFPNIHTQKLTFPHSLKKLSICMPGGFEWDNMLEKIGSLPVLEKLQLIGGCFGKGKWETEEGQFPSLKYFVLESFRGLVNWTAAEEGSSILPRLQHLSLRWLVDLKEIPFELGNIDTLKSIKLFNCEKAVRSVKEMFDEQVELLGGEDQLSFHVQVKLTWKKEQLLSLASPNFYVHLS